MIKVLIFVVKVLPDRLRRSGAASNSVKRRPRQRSAARIGAPNMSLSTGFSPEAIGMIFQPSPFLDE